MQNSNFQCLGFENDGKILIKLKQYSCGAKCFWVIITIKTDKSKLSQIKLLYREPEAKATTFP